MYKQKQISFKVYGANGHRQGVSFGKSHQFDTADRNGEAVHVSVFNSDITGTNEYSEVVINAATFKAIYDEIRGQITDGIFENFRTGKVIAYGMLHCKGYGDVTRAMWRG